MKHIIINVGRQVGAGGQEIGRMLAKDWKDAGKGFRSAVL